MHAEVSAKNKNKIWKLTSGKYLQGSLIFFLPRANLQEKRGVAYLTSQ